MSDNSSLKSANIITWDDSFAIAKRLNEHHPGLDLEDVSLGMIYCWVIALPEFDDDPDLANEDILMSIFQEWYEEVAT